MQEELDHGPGLARRAAAGAWHVPGGIGYLVVRPRLWLHAVLPAIVAGALVFAGLVFGWLAAPRVEESLITPAWPLWLAVPARVAIWVGSPLAGILAGFAVALLLAAPLLELVSREVEVLERGQSPDAARGFTWDLLQSVRGAAFFAAAAPAIFALGLVPLLGPVLAGLFAAYALAFQQTDAPLARRGLDFAERRAWHRRWRPESLGFGLAGLATLVVPFANLLLAPALAVGATRLVLELAADGTLPPAGQATRQQEPHRDGPDEAVAEERTGV
jgi:CysZ protein